VSTLRINISDFERFYFVFTTPSFTILIDQLSETDENISRRHFPFPYLYGETGTTMQLIY
jgi:hypothetical protein